MASFTYLARVDARIGDIVRKSAGTKLYRVVDHERGPTPRVLIRGVDSGGSFWVDGDTNLVLVEAAPWEDRLVTPSRTP